MIAITALRVLDLGADADAGQVQKLVRPMHGEAVGRAAHQPAQHAACVDSLHDAFAAADASPRDSQPVLRVSRLAADLTSSGGCRRAGGELLDICERAQHELAAVDQDVADRYFAGMAAGERGIAMVV